MSKTRFLGIHGSGRGPSPSSHGSLVVHELCKIWKMLHFHPIPRKIGNKSQSFSAFAQLGVVQLQPKLCKKLCKSCTCVGSNPLNTLQKVASFLLEICWKFAEASNLLEICSTVRRRRHSVQHVRKILVALVHVYVPKSNRQPQELLEICWKFAGPQRGTQDSFLLEIC